MSNIESLKRICTQTRRDILRMVHGAKSGHPGGALGATEYFVALFHEILHYDSKNFQMQGKNEDLFFLSNGHLSAVLYSTLARVGYFSIDELKTFRRLNSRLQGHPSPHEGLPGIRIASGSLGQGMSVAIGSAQAKKLSKDPFLIYSLHGDGELNEGQNWEAILYAGAKKVDNYITTIDYNSQQIDGSTESVMPLGDLKAKFEAFGWYVLQERQGNKLEQVIHSLKVAKTQSGKGKPIVLILHTDMGHGVDFMSGTHHWHGKAPNDEQLEKALFQLPETLGDYSL
ncbi:transketolase [Bacteroidetes bacterium endosymbiont of Geopemphigus sp.]|uniref:transketolase n=1 Tax=Bacteroidetes bacterium endosymbiont of Geopemphigus sp. TaxID=2047937 RepID=UPI000CD10E28|nr:transketolase [Bacteroidetes bacterium endosymbiont of Geopemphigus sp.]